MCQTRELIFVNQADGTHCINEAPIYRLVDLPNLCHDWGRPADGGPGPRGGKVLDIAPPPLGHGEEDEEAEDEDGDDSDGDGGDGGDSDAPARDAVAAVAGGALSDAAGVVL